MGKDLICPGCDKRFNNLNKYETHAKKCKELRAKQFSYNIPTVNLNDLPGLKAKQLPNSKDWGIWNAKANDWVRDKAGNVDSRIFERNINTLLSCIIAASIVADGHPET
jgi:hypothetical protein